MGIMLAVVTLQALTSALLIYLNKRYKGEDLYLSSYFAITFIHVLYKGFIYLAVDNLETFDKLHGAFSLLYGPLLFFYVQSIRKKSVPLPLILLHLTPFFLCFGLNIVMVIMLITQHITVEIMEYYHQVMMLLIFPSFLCYSVYALFVLRGKKADPIFKKKALISKLIASCNLLLSTLVLLGVVLQYLGLSEFPISMRYVYYFMMLVLFYSVLHIRMQMLLQSKTAESPSPKIAIDPQPKYRNSKISEDELEEILLHINDCFAAKKPFLDPDFSLDQLAKDLDINKLKITQALNMRLGQNFYQFVNSARIEESKALLQLPNEDNLTVVGYESGFKSKSTFYKYFKEATGCSPSDYKKSLQLNH